MTTEWYMEMAAAVAKREHAITWRNRWEVKLADAEARINELAATAPQAAPGLSGQEPGEQEQAA